MSAGGLVLSLFPGIDLLGRAFEEEGFCVVRGPDLVWGGDVHTFHPPEGSFDGVIGGPPCQAHSNLKFLVAANRKRARARGDMESYKEAPDLIPEFGRIVIEVMPRWYLMENVPMAPCPEVSGYHVQKMLLNDCRCGGVQNRLRRFTWGYWQKKKRLQIKQGPKIEEALPTACASGIDGDRMGAKTNKVLKSTLYSQGLPEDFLEHSPFTVEGAIKLIGNGVPMSMGRTVAAAVKKVI